MGNPTARFLKNTLSWFASNLAGRFVAAPLFILLTQLRPLTEAGAYALGQTYLAILMPFTLWGLDQILVRDVAQDHHLAVPYLRRFVFFRLILSVLTYSLLIIITIIVDYSDLTRIVILLIGVSLFSDSVSGLFEGMAIAFSHSTLMLWASLPVNLLRLGVGSALLLTGYGVVGLAVLFALSGLLRTLTLVWLVLRHILKQREDKSLFTPVIASWRQHFIQAYPFVFIDVSWAAEYQIGQILLSLHLGEEAVALFAAAFALISILTVAALAYMMTIFPIMSKLAQGADEQLNLVYKKSCQYMLVLSLPIAIVCSLASKEILGIIYPERFMGAAPVLALLVWTLPFSSMHAPVSRLMVIRNRHQHAAIFLGLGAVTNITLNIILIPQLGIIGTALARLCSYLLFFFLNYAYVHLYLHPLNLSEVMVRPALAGLIMTIGIVIVRPFNIWFAIAVGFILFMVALLVLRIINRDELNTLQQMLVFEPIQPTPNGASQADQSKQRDVL